MQLKGLVRFFAIALILISVYQLHFTWVVHNHESKMEARATSWTNIHFGSARQETKDSAYKIRLRRLLDSTKETTLTYGITGPISYQKAKEQELSLGLDLQGGIGVTLEVELQELLKSLCNNPKDPIFNKAILLATQRKSTSNLDFVTLFAQAYKELNPSGRLSALFANVGQRNIKIDDSDDQVVTKIRALAKDAFDNTARVMTKRIDQFGVAQANINADAQKAKIEVELPGVKDDPERVRKILQAAANLQFWEVYSPKELTKSFTDAEEALKNYYSGTKPTADTTHKVADTSKAVAKIVDTTKTGNITSLLNNNNPETTATTVTAANNLPVQNGTASFKNVLTQAGQYDVAFAYVQIKDTSLLNEYLNVEAVKNAFPSNTKFLYGIPPKGDNVRKDFLPIYAIKTREGTDKAPLEGDDVEEAGQSFDEKNRPSVQLNMTKQGANRWGELTTANVNKSIAIVLDNIVYSAPNVVNPITDGRSQISGSFTVEEAADLANILQSGKLPAPARIVHEQVVGPTLGREAIKGGALSFVISFVVIFGLMLLYYNTSGWVANIALVLNLLFTIGVLSALGATLTAAGIAGLVLAIGMAVDTNVIIFERIKEEISWGRSYTTAVDHGYNRSLSPILDAHVTTLLTAIILYIFGLGPIRGFATTQIIAILLNLFCGILVARLITEWWTTKKGRHFEYFTKLSRSIFKKAHFPFTQYRRIAYMISVVVLILGVGAFYNGFDEGVEYKGGRSYTVRFDQPHQNTEMLNQLHTVFGDYPLIKTVSDARTLDITTSYQKENPSQAADSIVEAALYTGLKPFLPAGISNADFQKNHLISSESVQPAISDELKAGAVKATIYALIIIFLYIFIRFRDWRFSLGTILSLLHDVLVTLAVFSYFKKIMPFPLEIDQHFIAAILTVIGFSMNDTVIVFDRIREYSKTMKGETKAKIVDSAINDTLSRTIMTSLTVFLTLLILFIFGGEVTRGFAFAMLVGVVTGTYSSIFVAAPILLDFAKNKPLGRHAEEPKVAPKPKTKTSVTH